MSECRGSVYCVNCGGVCSTEDPDRLEEVFRKRRLAEEAEARRGLAEVPICICASNPPDHATWAWDCPVHAGGGHKP